MLKLTPYDFQTEGIDFHLPRPYSINGFTMGLGKTLVGLATCAKANTGKVLIVCPAFLVPNWQSEIEKFMSDPTPFEVVSYNGLKHIDMSEYGALIVDEAHGFKNLQAKRTKLLHKLIAEHKPKRLMLLTGTPIKNDVTEFFSLLRLCWLGGKYPEFDIYGNSFHRFANTFSNKKVTPWATKYEGLKNVERLKELLAPVYIRRRAEDVLDLPPEVDREVLFSERDSLDSQLASAWDNYEGTKSKNFSTGKAISALAKVAYTVEFVKENIEEMGKVVIFTDHVQSAKNLYSELHDYGAHFVTGGTLASKRSEYVSSINGGDARVLISTIGSLSVGVNLTGVNHMIFNDLPWVPADISQARKRIHRIGQKNTCFYYYILASRIDQAIVRTLDKKRKVLEAMEDGSYAKSSGRGEGDSDRILSPLQH